MTDYFFFIIFFFSLLFPISNRKDFEKFTLLRKTWFHPLPPSNSRSSLLIFMSKWSVIHIRNKKKIQSHHTKCTSSHEITSLRTVVPSHYLDGWPLWQYGLWSFQMGDKKLERFLPKNQHTQRKSLNFENWISGGLRSFHKSDF